MDASVPPHASKARSLLERADSILEAFDAQHASLSLLGIVARTGLPKTTVHRTIHKMLDLGWLECQEGRYLIGARLVERAALACGRMSAWDTTRPYLEELCAATHQAVHLAVLDGPEVVLLQRLGGERPMPSGGPRDGRLPALCTALGKALVAFGPADASEEIIDAGLRARTPHTVTSPLRLRQELARIRGEGIGYDRGEFAVALRCIAAPVTSADGRAVSALSITARGEPPRFFQLAPLVRRAAEQASRALAGQLGHS